MPYKSTRFPHLQGLNFMSKNAYLADLVTIIGTQDLVFVKLIGNNMPIGNILKICLNSTIMKTKTLITNFLICEDIFIFYINLVRLVFMKSIGNNMAIENILKICLNLVIMKNKNYNSHFMIFVENQNLANMKAKDKRYIIYNITLRLWRAAIL